jgi:large subunit ribosomal protein L21e
MPAGHGTRARTRDSFSRPFRGKGYIPLSIYLRTYRIGEYVDIKVNSAVQKVCQKWQLGHTERKKSISTTTCAEGILLHSMLANRAGVLI